MGPKALLIAALVLFSSTAAYGCVNFWAQTSGGSDALISGILWDNGGNTCTISSTYPYDLDCVAGYSSSFNSGKGVVQYSTPHGSYSFATSHSGSVWDACVFGCSDSECFAPGCTSAASCSP